MGILDIMNDPNNRAMLGAGLLDMSSGFGGRQQNAVSNLMRQRSLDEEAARRNKYQDWQMSQAEQKAAEAAEQKLLQDAYLAQLGIDNPDLAQAAGAGMMDLYKYQNPEAKERKTLEDAAGYHRYMDTGDRVFPGVQGLSGEAGQTGMWKNTKDRFSAERGLSSDFKRWSDDFNSTRFQHQAITGASDDGMGDMVRIKGINKILDPTSTVRSEESKEAAAVGGKLREMMNLYKNLAKGDTLTQDVRDQMNFTANRLMEIRARDYRNRYKSVQRQARQYQLDEANIFQGAFNPFAQEQPVAAPPALPGIALPEIDASVPDSLEAMLRADGF